MQTVRETKAFRRQAEAAGLTEDDVWAIVDVIARRPESGDEIVGTGGCRKLRFALPGTGKSGGVRTITFFSGPDYPVTLLAVFAKGRKVNLTQAERNALAKLTKLLLAADKVSLAETVAQARTPR